MAFTLLLSGLVLSFLVVSPSSVYASDRGFYQQTNLVSDQAGMARFTDPSLVNPWGIAYGPTSPFWIADNHTGVSTLYNGQGQPFPTSGPLVVTVPLPGGGTSSPTGIVFNGSSDFVVSKGGNSGPSLFIFTSEDGTLSGWNPKVDLTNAILTVDNSASGAVYKGLALGSSRSQNFLFATNFSADVVDVYDANFRWVRSFTDKKLAQTCPLSGQCYAPFGIRNIGGLLYVTFALQKPDKHDDMAGPGHGFVDVFNTNGHLLKRLIAHGALNSPWGLALAPSDFGRFSKALLVGNFGNGWINAFDPDSGAFLGSLKDKHGNPIVIDGLWALTFGNGTLAGETDTLFFTAGPNDESHGLFGSIESKD
jgi:uncharacterized protein (TIGR03118 family)